MSVFYPVRFGATDRPGTRLSQKDNFLSQIEMLAACAAPSEYEKSIFKAERLF